IPVWPSGYCTHQLPAVTHQTQLFVFLHGQRLYRRLTVRTKFVMGRSRSRSRSRERGGREERGRADRDRDRAGRRRDRDQDRSSRKRSPPRRHFREDGGKDAAGKDTAGRDKSGKVDKSNATTSESSKPSKQEARRAEAAIKRQKMLEEQQREKNKVKDRLHLIRQMKGDASGEEDALGSGSDGDDDDEDLTEEQQMMKLMGFAGFDTTKGKGVEDNKRGPAKGAISKHKEREYRQYMNRRGGFNRPLDKI
ncbi:unnamed protein product, partial [Ectocarpus sp. 12 AP-2014]